MTIRQTMLPLIFAASLVFHMANAAKAGDLQPMPAELETRFALSALLIRPH